MAGLKLNAKQLRKGEVLSVKREERRFHEIYIVLDNVLDTYNIGSIFRLADAITAQKVYLCGGTETPPNPRIKKASINTTEWVDWQYKGTAIEVINDLRLRIQDLKVVAIEQSQKSVPYDHYEYTFPICFVVGNETTGVSKEVLDIADAVVEIPMFGVNISLNVVASLAIVLYKSVESEKL